MCFIVKRYGLVDSVLDLGTEGPGLIASSNATLPLTTP